MLKSYINKSIEISANTPMNFCFVFSLCKRSDDIIVLSGNAWFCTFSDILWGTPKFVKSLLIQLTTEDDKYIISESTETTKEVTKMYFSEHPLFKLSMVDIIFPDFLKHINMTLQLFYHEYLEPDRINGKVNKSYVKNMIDGNDVRIEILDDGMVLMEVNENKELFQKRLSKYFR